ncbi:hypothetical protein M5D96_000836 [Drosophila gunungcola]|uniref:Uncharacterized protein n=1 Tax=Drosophila gunungcola TaxID=103775 RepID=A0A9P9YWX1_9MUSC|nr:hypothetical protein M5D96_000836 [Drosophila gunungcola]
MCPPQKKDGKDNKLEYPQRHMYICIKVPVWCKNGWRGSDNESEGRRTSGVGVQGGLVSLIQFQTAAATAPCPMSLSCRTAQESPVRTIPVDPSPRL